ncbi:MAG: CapA family protein [Deltaproteobacteria bacterium]|nr:CapA family protein [Deltaproteobacteria bacterium]
MRLRDLAASGLGLLALACSARASTEPLDAQAPVAVSTSPDPPALPDAPAARRLRLVAAGDISYGREVGQVLLRKPGHDFFAPISRWLGAGDVRFANLESVLTDRHGETQSPDMELVFSGPPSGADSLKRSGFDVVSLANNHAWDYGKKGFFETLDNLDRVGIRYVGAGRDRKQAYGATIVEHGGVRLAVLAVTDIWNQGVLRTHKAAEFVAGPDKATLVESVRALRADPTLDAIAVSHHGGCEFLDHPLPRTRELAHAAIDAGADVIIGHHPHVVQGIEWYRDRPILYSLGNLVMRLKDGRPRDGTGYLARIELAPFATPVLWICPYRIDDYKMRPFAEVKTGQGQEKRFLRHLGGISRPWGGIAFGVHGEDGCWQVHAAPVGPEAPPPSRRAQGEG